MQVAQYSPQGTLSNKTRLRKPNLKEAEAANYSRITWLAIRNTQETGEAIPNELLPVFENPRFAPYKDLVLGHCYAQPENIGKGWKNRPDHEYCRRAMQIALRGLTDHKKGKHRIGLEQRRLVFAFTVNGRGNVRYLVFKHPILEEEFWSELERYQSNQLMRTLCRLQRHVADPYEPLLRYLRRSERQRELDPLQLAAPGTGAPCWEEESAYDEEEYDPPRYNCLYVEHVKPRPAVAPEAPPAAEVDAPATSAFSSQTEIAQGVNDDHPLGDQGALHNAPASSGGDPQTLTSEIPPMFLKSPLQLEYEALTQVIETAQQEHRFSWRLYANCIAAESVEARLKRLKKLAYAISVVRQHELVIRNEGKKIRSFTKTLEAALTWGWKLRTVGKNAMRDPNGSNTAKPRDGVGNSPNSDEKSPQKSATPPPAAPKSAEWHPSAAGSPVWLKIVAQCHVSDAAKEAWLCPLRVEEVDAFRLRVYAPTAYIRDWVRGHMLEPLEAAAGMEVVTLELSEELRE